MRPRIVEYLNSVFGTGVFEWLVPESVWLYALAMLLALFVLMRRSKGAGVSRYHAAGAALWMMAGGLLGTRAFFLVQHLDATLANPRQILDPGGGLASWGAYLGGFAALLIYCRYHRLETPRYADLAVPCLGLGIAVGRLSCFLNGDDYGTLSNLPWAVSFPHASYPFVAQARAGLISPVADLSLPVHPVQIYLALNGLLLFLLASRFYKKFRERPGATFCFYWLCYCTTRFALEYLRGDQSTQLFMDTLTVPQLMCLLTFVPAALGLRRALRREETTHEFKPSRPADVSAKEATHAAT